MNIRAFILGADYLKQRDALISACEEYGPGKLVHPYFGTRTVNCVTCREFETSLEGGIIHFDLSFVETVVTSIPRVQKDTESDLIRSFNDTIRTAGEYYERGIKGIDRAASSIEDTSEALLAVSDQIENQFAHLMRFTDSIDTMRRSVSDFKSTLVYSVSEPTRAWNKLVGLWWKRREREGPKRAVKWGPVAELDGPVI
jgi:prophage DNA circulation protein